MAQLYEKAPEKSEPLEARLWQPTLVVSPDAVYPYALGLKGNIAGKNPIFVIDVPEGVEMVAWSDKYWWGKDKAELLRTEKIKRENGNYTRHTFAVSLGFAQPWLHSYFRLFFKTAKTSGPVQPLYYRTGQDGNLYTEKSAPVEIVRIPQSKVPKRFVSMMGCDYEMMKKYPDWQNNLRRMGVNGVCLNYNVPRDGLATVEEVRTMNHAMKKDGFVTATMGAGFFGPPETKELSAVDINGKTTHNFDFTARGPFMDQAAERMCKLGGEPEFDMLISDYEAYFNGYNLSFTERTLSKFKKYFEEKHKNMKYVDPKTMTLQKREYPEHYKIWVEWKSAQFFEYMSDIAAKVRAKHPKLKIGFCTTPGVSEWQCKEVYLQDNRLWNNTFLDHNVTMVYNNLYSTMHNCRAEMDTMGGMAEGTKAVFFPALTFGFWSEIEYKFPPEDSRHIIYEAVTSGAKGYWVFPGFVGGNGWHYAEMALANRVIAENEETLLDGRRADGLVKKTNARRADGGAVDIRPKVLVLKNKAVVYLAEYSGKEISGEAVMDLPFECEARDAETGENLGKVGKDGALKFKFGGKVKARMFVLEGPEGGEFPKETRKSAANTADSPSLDDASLVFYDSFDTEPLKGGMIDNYQIFSSLGGVKNNCLKVTDYRGGCVYDESVRLKSGNATIDLWHTPGRDFGKGTKTEFTVLRVTAGGDYQIWLDFNGSDGKLRLVARKDGKYLWESAVRSKIDSWTNSWYNIRVSFGDKGAALWVNGELQEESRRKWPAVAELTKVQLGATWRTFGLFDELKIYDLGLKDKKN